MNDWCIERMEPDSWERVRAVRLSALADAPDAFGTTVREDQQRPLAAWRTRLENPNAVTFVACSRGEDVGLVTGVGAYDERTYSAGLFGMWVAPKARGRGVGGALLDAVVAWAKDAGYTRLLLEVADLNPAAVRLYERRGFEPTGARGRLPPPREHILEYERALEL